MMTQSDSAETHAKPCACACDPGVRLPIAPRKLKVPSCDPRCPGHLRPQIAVPHLGIVPRSFAFAVTLGCATVLLIASWLTPDPRGLGSHTKLGMPRCEFEYRTGIPCPSCGMTTSFAHFAATL